MIQLAIAILELGEEVLLQCDSSNLMLTLTREVIGKTLQDPLRFKRLIELVNTRFSADSMLPLGWQ
jgi:hypothetical protein